MPSVEASNFAEFNTGTDPQTVGITVPAALSDSMLLVTSQNGNFQPGSWSSDVDGAPDAVFAGHNASGDFVQWARWMSPTAGAHTITADYAGAIRGSLIAIVLSDVDQATPVGTPAVDDDTAGMSAGLAAIASAVGDLVIGVITLSDECVQDVGPSGSETSVATTNYNIGQANVAYVAGAATSTAIGWDWTTCNLTSVMSGFAVKPAATGETGAIDEDAALDAAFDALAARLGAITEGVAFGFTQGTAVSTFFDDFDAALGASFEGLAGRFGTLDEGAALDAAFDAILTASERAIQDDAAMGATFAALAELLAGFSAGAGLDATLAADRSRAAAQLDATAVDATFAALAALVGELSAGAAFGATFAVGAVLIPAARDILGRTGRVNILGRR
jgi:hypothetical protein